MANPPPLRSGECRLNRAGGALIVPATGLTVAVYAVASVPPAEHEQIAFFECVTASGAADGCGGEHGLDELGGIAFAFGHVGLVLSVVGAVIGVGRESKAEDEDGEAERGD